MLKYAAVIGNFIILSIIVVAVSLFWLAHEANKPGNLAEEKILYVKPGTSLRAISEQLLAENVISNNLVFLIKAKIENRHSPLKAGEYSFEPKIRIKEVIDKMQQGKNYQRSVTLPEGLTSTEIVTIINSNEFLAGDNVVSIPYEGSLLPETYNFTLGDTKQEIVNRMQKAMTETIDKLWEERSDDLSVKDKNEAIILASIVEKETAVKEERPRVAGVFMNRLDRGIPLQTDPTVIYALTMGKEKLARGLTLKDLKKPSPYNTYTVKGLPPTPIANPGKESIAAVLNPEYNSYIYFVADGNGGHVFAEKLEEHNKNVRKWRKLKNNPKE